MLAPEVQRLVYASVRAFADGLGAHSLQECFGWQALPGERSIARRLAEAKRLGAFADAWRAQSGCEALAPWRRCEILAAEIEEFESLYWPAWKDAGPPAGASRLRAALHTVYATLDRSPPKTAKGIHELLKRARVLT